MKQLRTRSTMFVVSVLLVLAISALQVVPVLADDAAPPPPEATEVIPPPGENASPEMPPTEPAQVPVIDVEGPPPAGEISAVVAEPVPVEETPAEILAQLPEGTEIVVLDESGQTLPLVSEDAAEAFYTGDPQWCPVGVTPGAPTCSGVKDSFNGGNADTDLIQWLIDNHPAMAGVIWIADGYIGTTALEGGTILLNGDLFVDPANPSTPSIADFALTIKGGWTGMGTSIDSSTPSLFNVPVSIIGWTGAITLSNILFSGVTSGPTLNVETTGNITVTGVKVGTQLAPNTGAGAVLDNSAGNGSVTITKSRFSYNNGGPGLDVRSRGAITLSEVSANGNAGAGAILDNNTSGTAKNVTLTSGLFEFNGNGGTGLQISSRGAIALKDINANGNFPGYGAYLDNLVGTGAVTLTGTNIFSENGSGGLAVQSRGAITASNLIANSSVSGWGVSLNNAAATTALAVTLTGSNQFKFNGGGLQILSVGAITLNNINASSNRSESGVSLTNSSSSAGSNVTLTGTNVFNENFYSGLMVQSRGAIILSNTTASGNGLSGLPGGFGVYLSNTIATVAKAVTLNGINTFNDNFDSGLSIRSTGTITLNKITANNNQDDSGVSIDNTYALPSAPQNVTILGYVNASGNGYSGLSIRSYGLITLSNVTASGNGTSGMGSGAYLNNCVLSGPVCLTITPKAVTLTGNNTFNNNVNDGVNIVSKGAITLNNAIANENMTGYGANLDNQHTGAVGGITISNTATYSPSFSNNGNSGLEASSNGNILLKDLEASGNGGYGVYLVNGAAGNVTLGTGRLNWVNEFNDNFLSGLEVYSNGAVLLSNLSASGNGNNTVPFPYGYGLLVDNNSSLTPKAVTLLGSNSFNENYSDGVYITTLGAILASKLSANDNSNGSGALFDNNTNPALPQNVTLNGYGTFNRNGLMGLQITTFGTVTLNSIYADNNAGNGIFVINAGGSLARGVTINGYAEVINNGGAGLAVSSPGPIKVTNLYALNNSGAGAMLNTTYSTAVSPQNVTILGYGQFINNGDDGLDVLTYGLITLTNLTANGNGWGPDPLSGYGVMLDNYLGTAVTPKGLLLNGTNTFNGNDLDGLYVESLGSINASNLTASGNNGDGASLNNQWDTGYFSVTLTGSNFFENNAGDGLGIWSNGLVTLNNLSANWNTGDGAYINAYNTVTAPGAKVTLTGNNTFLGNGDDTPDPLGGPGTGLVVLSDSVITINNLTASENTQLGAALVAFNPTSWPSLPVTIKLTGINTFNANGLAGLYFESPGNVDITKITADNNGENGVSGNAAGNITLTCGSTTNNTAYGWSLNSSGVVTLRGVFAYGNGINTNLLSGTLVYVRTCPLP